MTKLSSFSVFIIATVLISCNSVKFNLTNNTESDLILTTLEKYSREEIVDYNIADMHFGTGAIGSYYIDSLYQVKIRPRSSASIFFDRKFIKKNNSSLIQVIKRENLIVDTIVLRLRPFKSTYKYRTPDQY